MKSNSELLLCNILDCGTIDLSLLEDVDTDVLYDAYDECVSEFGKVTLNDLMFCVFQRAICVIDDAREERIKELRVELDGIDRAPYDDLEITDEDREDVRFYREDEAASRLDRLVSDGDVTQEELDREAALNTALKFAELDALLDMDPYNDIESYHNCLDTHVWLNRHEEDYQIYLGSALDEFENLTGFSLES